MRKPSDQWHPEELRFHFGGHPEGSWVELEWQKPILLYRRNSAHTTKIVSTRLRPRAASWNKFWLDVAQIGVWAWSGDYSTPGIEGGTSWSLAMSHLDQSVRCHGKNGFPGGKGPDFPLGSSFDLFLQSLQGLTGKRY